MPPVATVKTSIDEAVQPIGLEPETPQQSVKHVLARKVRAAVQTPVPAPEPEPVPRIVSEYERAEVPGLRRWRIRLGQGDVHPSRYVLARTEAEAKACYLASIKVSESESVRLVIVPLAD
jgi:hypothetical protein